MAERRLTVLIAFADRLRAEELAAYLTEEEGMRAILSDEVVSADGAATRYDLVVSDGGVMDQATPHVVLNDHAATSAGGIVRAALSPTAADSVIAAALRLAAAGYRIAPVGDTAVSPADDESHDLPYATGGHRLAPLGTAVLTQRERQVIALLAEGASNKLIARRLDISVHTAKFHVAAILEKLGAVNRTDAIAIAMREGLVLV